MKKEIETRGPENQFRTTRLIILYRLLVPRKGLTAYRNFKMPLMPGKKSRGSRNPSAYKFAVLPNLKEAPGKRRRQKRRDREKLYFVT